MEMDVRRLESTDARWDSMISKDKNADFVQSIEWARILELTYGHESYLLELLDDGRPAGYFTVFTNTTKGRSNLISYNGPAILQPEKTVQIFKAFIDWLDILTDEKKIKSIKLTLLKSNWAESGNPQIIEKFTARGYGYRTWTTYLVDLNQTEKDLWMYINKSARKSLKKVRGSGAVVKKARDYHEFIEKFIQPYNQMEKEHGRSGVPLSQIEKTRNLDYLNKYYHYYYTEFEGHIHGVIGMCVFNGIAEELMSSASKFSYDNKLYVQDMMHWQMFLDAKNLGCHTFDLAGVNPEPKSSRRNGVASMLNFPYSRRVTRTLLPW
jgi:lipid II:glycine glycyltransferase (peptidoglycan interpeptide bridge formation enzyme)